MASSPSRCARRACSPNSHSPGYRVSYESRLANKVRKLEDTLKGRRTIEKAVKILTEMNGVDEEAAYKLIRDQATSKRVAIVSVAESIISARRR